MSRIVIEVPEDTREDLLHLVEQLDDAEVITEYDAMERVTERVEKIANKLSEFAEDGVNMRVLNYYLRGRGVAQRDIDNVKEGVMEFLGEYGLPNDEETIHA